jgi:hypothetical protein
MKDQGRDCRALEGIEPLPRFPVMSGPAIAIRPPFGFAANALMAPSISLVSRTLWTNISTIAKWVLTLDAKSSARPGPTTEKELAKWNK